MIQVNLSYSQIRQVRTSFDSSTHVLQDTIVKNKYKKSLFNKGSFKLGGALFVEAQIASSPYNLQQIPLNYVRTTLTPEVELWGIPFNSTINLTTEQLQTNYNLSRVQFSLDVQKLTQNYRKKLAERLRSNISDTTYNRNYEKLLSDSVNKINVIEKELDYLRTEFDILTKSNDSLKNLYGDLELDSLHNLSLKERLQYKELVKANKVLETKKQAIDSLETIANKGIEIKKQYAIHKETIKGAPRQIQELGQARGRLLKGKFKNHKYLSTAERLLATVRDLKIGTIHTNRNNTNIHGATINGIAVENSFGKIFTSVEAGVLQQNFAFGQLEQTKNNNYLYTIKAGYGMPEASHLHAGFTRSGKIGKGVSNNEGRSIPVVENSTIYSLEGAYVISKSLKLEGDWAIANSEQNIGLARTSQPFAVATLPSKYLQSPNTTYTVKATSNLFNNRTRAVIQQQYVGASFLAPGNPFLRNDILRRKATLTQKLFKNYITARFTYQNDRDNQLNQKSHTTTVTNYKGDLKIRFKKIPSFIVSYSLIQQATNSTVSEIPFNYLNTIAVYSITSVYSKRIKTKVLTSSLTYIRQDVSNNFSAIKRGYHTLTSTATISNFKGDNISWSGTVTQTTFQPNTTVISNQLEGSYVHRKNEKFVTTLGGNYTSDNFLGNNGGVFVRQTFSFFKNNSIALLLRQNFFQGVTSNSQTIHQSIINIQFIQKW